MWSGLKEKLQKQEKALTEKDLYLKEKNEVIAALEKQQESTKGELEQVKNKNKGQWKGHPLLKIRRIFGSKMGNFRVLSSDLLQIKCNDATNYTVDACYQHYIFCPELETELKTKDQQLVKTEAKIKEINAENQDLGKNKIIE